MVVEQRTFLGNLSAHTFKLSLHVVFSPFLQREIPNCRTMHRRKTKYEHLNVDEQFVVFHPLDGIYLLNISFPAGETSIFLGRAGFEEFYNCVSSV
jgi:hypothetical protein